MMTLAKKLITGSGARGELEVNGYVEFVSSTPMMITPKYSNSGVTLQYSVDGTTWTPIVSGATTPSANIIYFIGSATGTKSLYTASSNSNAWTFTGATNLECNGKLDRLLQNTLGSDINVLTIGDYCYSSMFYGCTSLITAPELPATTLAASCYQAMFYNCTSLTTAPALPATTLATSCYSSMFYGCTSLIIAPELPATILMSGCYSYMFYGCLSLTTAPELPATTLNNNNNCYSYMFYGCLSLTTAPELPATTLAAYCYEKMFYSCTSLTTAPALPATTLVNYCYQAMFLMCSSLKLSTTMTGIYDTAYRIPTSGTGTTSTAPLTNMFSSTGGTFKGTPEINTTYYTENTPI